MPDLTAFLVTGFALGAIYALAGLSILPSALSRPYLP